MNLTVHTLDSAPEASQTILRDIAEDLGFLPNFAAAISASPTLLGAFDGMRRAVVSGELDPAVRETAGVAVGVAVDNHYGVAFHSTVLDGVGVDGTEIDRMRAGELPSDPRLAAAYELAQRIVLDRGKVPTEVVARAEAAGFTPNEILEILAESAFASLVGLVDNLAQHVELDPPLVPRAWG
jgi:alkylhydroperoxidase family enzyme